MSKFTSVGESRSGYALVFAIVFCFPLLALAVPTERPSATTPLHIEYTLSVDEVAATSAPTDHDEDCSKYEDMKHEPICGSDGKTYTNTKSLECTRRKDSNNGEALWAVYKGACDDPCWLSLERKNWTSHKELEERVCGSDGIIYPNIWVLKCKANSNKLNPIAVSSKDLCKGNKEFEPCDLAYVAQRKVCGSDNVTYNNIWNLKCTSKIYNVDISVQHDGPCKIICPYSPIYSPVCSKSEYMFANIEALKCRQLLSPYTNNKLHHEGHCARHAHINPCHLDTGYDPVCASNGQTYGNPKQVKCQKQVNSALLILHSGPCTVEEVKNTLMKLGGEEWHSVACKISIDRYEWNSVCGSDNTTYANPYRYLCMSGPEAISQNEDDIPLRVLYQGECGGFDYCRLVKEARDSPICGNDGITYRNQEELYCMQQTKKHLHHRHLGPCNAEDDPCLFRGYPFLEGNGNPVCASNGVTYVSPQAVWCASKTDPGIEFIHDGECF